MHFAIAVCVFGIAATFVNGECTLPNNDRGTCKTVNTCETAKKILTKKQRTSLDEKFLRDSACGFDPSGQPQVCCPDSATLSCATPDGQKGECISIQRCSHLEDRRNNPATNADTEYVKSSVCPGPEEDSVCCGPSTEARYGEPGALSCEKTQSAFPPDPNGDCCGIDSTFDNKILGGNETAIDQYSWLVVIEYVKLGDIRLFCGGSLISAKYVLTAGHCVKGRILLEGTPKNVRLGEYNTANEGPDCVPSDAGEPDCTDGMIRAPIEQTIPHPDYNPSSLQRKHDIALIRLKTYALYSDFVRPICLPTVDYSVAPPSEFRLYVAGWGRYIQDVQSGIYRSSKIKLHVDVPYVSREVCQGGVRKINDYTKNVNIWNGQICAGGVNGKDSCKGDSGGPLMYENNRKYQILGVVSYGSEICGLQGIPGVYTYVYEYLPWIKSTIRE